MKFTTLAIALVTSSGANAFVQNSPVRVATPLQSYLDDIGGGGAAAPEAIVSYLNSLPVTHAAGGAG
eukprot:CAMPEP_0172307300 /NCGR_PEP_ID=MMETSP1058-20130122/8189_1 /TAXON_ID=83371 /ORGANISM="Detonula confervacea, Strain CCMP 353" /LENGTH=66 /DNA_ID=CAMNT_0013019433 /DNA_START=87 /DNA_END=284 /DNA_ORIENTATION=+